MSTEVPKRCTTVEGPAGTLIGTNDVKQVQLAIDVVLELWPVTAVKLDIVEPIAFPVEARPWANAQEPRDEADFPPGLFPLSHGHYSERTRGEFYF